jgi:hypothetical protein
MEEVYIDIGYPYPYWRFWLQPASLSATQLGAVVVKSTEKNRLAAS